MAIQGTASKSSSGASMSKYDVEVEKRLQALEAVSHPVPTGATQQKVDDRLAALEGAISNIEAMVSALERGVAECKANCSGNGGTVSAPGLKEATENLGLEGKIDAVIDALS